MQIAKSRDANTFTSIESIKRIDLLNVLSEIF